MRACPEIAEIVLVVAPEDVERARWLLFRPDGDKPERVVAGGATRTESVRLGIQEASPESDLVVVHDGARPLVTPELVARCLAAAAVHGAVVAALPATDTVKQADGEGVVTATLDRSQLWLAQTPQVFRRRLLEAALEAAAAQGASGTDDASLVERLGHPVHLVPGDPDNLKVTWPEDLARAERHMSRRNDMPAKGEELRAGIGYDAHRFSEGRPLVLAGVVFPGERGLHGHSDADVVCHAICDALLGAMGAGDIGQHFPDSDPSYAGASSLALLARVAGMARGAGWEIASVDAVVIAETPRLSPRLAEMRRALAEAMQTGLERVSVKGKTTEGMGFTGRREGVAAHAVALVRRAAAG